MMHAYGLAVCAVAGAVAAWLRVPLPWIIGPLIAMAVFRFSGVPLTAPWWARFFGQIAIGAALGLYFTPPVARQMAAYWPVFIAAGLFAMLLAYAGGVWIGRATGADRTTAFLASAPGGSQEMTNLGIRYGARLDLIVIAQSLRIVIVVVTVPFALTFAGVHGADAYQAISVPVAPMMLLALFGCCAAGGAALQLVRMPNAWMLGPLFVSIGLTANGVEWSSMPPIAANAAQVLIGCNLGQRFERESLARAPRFAVSVVIAAFVGLAVSALFGMALAHAAGLAGTTMILATAPGGIAEMCLTAKVLQLGVPIVTAAHVARVGVLVTLTAPALYFAHGRQSRGGGR